MKNTTLFVIIHRIMPARKKTTANLLVFSNMGSTPSEALGTIFP
jgi:hypothetical protein